MLFFPDGQNKFSVEIDSQVLPYSILSAPYSNSYLDFLRKAFFLYVFCFRISPSAMVNYHWHRTRYVMFTFVFTSGAR